MELLVCRSDPSYHAHSGPLRPGASGGLLVIEGRGAESRLMLQGLDADADDDAEYTLSVWYMYTGSGTVHFCRH